MSARVDAFLAELDAERAGRFNDGDSPVDPQGGEFRLTGFDAPEISHPEKGLAPEPGAAISTMLGNELNPTITPTGERDVYGRRLADATTAEGTTLAEENLRRGVGFLTDNDPRNVRAFNEGLAARFNPQTREQELINQTLEHDWARAEPNDHNQYKKRRRSRGEQFSDAIDRGLDSMGLMVGGFRKLVGDTEGGQRQIDDNRRDLFFNQPDNTGVENIRTLDDALTWTIETLGEQGPMLGANVGAAMLTGGASAAASAAATRLAGQRLATEAAKRAMATYASRGAVAGSGTTGMVLNSGETKVELEEVDPGGDHDLLALGVGLTKTGLDFVAMANTPGLRKLFGKYASKLGLTERQALTAFSQVPKATLQAALIEGGTEGLQTVLDEAAKEYRAQKPYEFNTSNVINAAAAGALTGGVAAGIGGSGEVLFSKVAAEPAPPGGTTPEPEQDINAQIAAVANPDDPKQAMFVAGGDMKIAARMRAAGLKVGVIRDEDENGLIGSVDASLIDRVKEEIGHGVPLRDAVGRVLQLPEGRKARAVTDANPQVVQIVEPEGAVVTEAVTPEAEVPATQAALAEQMTPDQTQRVVPVAQAQQRRAEMVAAEEATGPTVPDDYDADAAQAATGVTSQSEPASLKPYVVDDATPRAPDSMVGTVNDRIMKALAGARTLGELQSVLAAKRKRLDGLREGRVAAPKGVSSPDQWRRRSIEGVSHDVAVLEHWVAQQDPSYRAPAPQMELHNALRLIDPDDLPEHARAALEAFDDILDTPLHIHNPQLTPAQRDLVARMMALSTRSGALDALGGQAVAQAAPDVATAAPDVAQAAPDVAQAAPAAPTATPLFDAALAHVRANGATMKGLVTALGIKLPEARAVMQQLEEAGHVTPADARGRRKLAQPTLDLAPAPVTAPVAPAAPAPQAAPASQPSRLAEVIDEAVEELAQAAGVSNAATADAYGSSDGILNIFEEYNRPEKLAAMSVGELKTRRRGKDAQIRDLQRRLADGTSRGPRDRLLLKAKELEVRILDAAIQERDPAWRSGSPRMGSEGIQPYSDARIRLRPGAQGRQTYSEDTLRRWRDGYTDQPVSLQNTPYVPGASPVEDRAATQVESPGAFVGPTIPSPITFEEEASRRQQNEGTEASITARARVEEESSRPLTEREIAAYHRELENLMEAASEADAKGRSAEAREEIDTRINIVLDILEKGVGRDRLPAPPPRTMTTTEPPLKDKSARPSDAPSAARMVPAQYNVDQDGNSAFPKGGVGPAPGRATEDAGDVGPATTRPPRTPDPDLRRTANALREVADQRGFGELMRETLRSRYTDVRLLAAIFLGRPQPNLPPAPESKWGPDGWQGVHARVELSKYARQSVYASPRGTNPDQPAIAMVDGQRREIPLREWNRIAKSAAARSLRQEIAVAIGLGRDEAAYYGDTGADLTTPRQRAFLLHALQQFYLNAPDSLIDEMLARMHNDKRYPLARIGRADGATQDNTAAGLSRPGREADRFDLLTQPPDEGEEYAGTDISDELAESQQTTVDPEDELPAREAALTAALREAEVPLVAHREEFKDPKNGKKSQRTTTPADMVRMILDNPIFARYSPTQIAKWFKKRTSGATRYVRMAYTMPGAAVRPDLRKTYPNGTTTLQLIKDGLRRSTTRRAEGLRVGTFVRFEQGGPQYRITRIETPDFSTAEGRDAWAEAEGWDTDYVLRDRKLRAQVTHPDARQFHFEPVPSRMLAAIRQADQIYLDTGLDAPALPERRGAAEARRQRFMASGPLQREWQRMDPQAQQIARSFHRATYIEQETADLLDLDVRTAEESYFERKSELDGEFNYTDERQDGDSNLEQIEYNEALEAERRARNEDRIARGLPPTNFPYPRTDRDRARMKGTLRDADPAVDEQAADQRAPTDNDTLGLVQRLFGGVQASVAAVRAIKTDAPRGWTQATKAVDALIAAAPKGSLLRGLLTMFRPFVDGYTLQFTNERNAKPGEIDPENKHITIRADLDADETLHILLHELAHAATFAGLRNNPLFRTRITQLRDVASDHYRWYGFDGATVSELSEIEYGLTDNDEFLAQLFSSPAFLRFLESVPATGAKRLKATRRKNVLTKVIAAIRDLLGIRNAKDIQSLADEAIDAALLEIVKGPQDSTTLRKFSANGVTPAARNRTAARVAQTGRQVMGYGKRTKDFLLDAGQFLLTSNWVMQREGSDELAARFFSPKGGSSNPAARVRSGLFDRQQDEARRHLQDYLGRMQRMNATPERVAAAWLATEQAMAQGLSREQLAARNPVAGELQEFFAGFDRYMRGAGVRGYNPPDGEIYLPQVSDRDKIAPDMESFIRFLSDPANEFKARDPVTGLEHPVTEEMARKIAEAIVSPHDHVAVMDTPYAGSLMHRVLTSPQYQQRAREEGWLINDPAKIIPYYIDTVTRAVEFEREFGGNLQDMSPDGEGDMMFEHDDKRLRQHLRHLYGEAESDRRFDQQVQRAIREGWITEYVSPTGVRQYAIYARDAGWQELLARTLVTRYGSDVRRAGMARARINKVLTGYNGALGADMNPAWRQSQQWVAVAQTLTVLSFSALMSLSEPAVQIARAPKMGDLLKGLRDVIKDVNGARTFLRELGYGWNQIINIALLDNPGYVQLDKMPRKIVDKFFTWNGQHLFTYASRMLAAHTAVAAFERAAREGDVRFLRDMGLTPQQVLRWLADGRPMRETPVQLAARPPGFTGPVRPLNVGEYDTADTHPVVMAIHRFIGDRVIVPDASIRPVFMNDPRFMLISQLKGFLYGYGAIVIGGMGREAARNFARARDDGDTRTMAFIQSYYRFAVLAAVGIPLAALAGEMRDWIKHDLWGQDQPEMPDPEGLQKYWSLLRRTGALGPFEPAVGLFDERSHGLISLLGPAAGHLDVGLEHGFFSEEFLRRSTPVLNQMPGAWRTDTAQALLGMFDDEPEGGVY